MTKKAQTTPLNDPKAGQIMTSTSQYRQDRPETIQNLFDSIAGTYDLGNTLMSFGLHRRWNRLLTRSVQNPGQSQVYLDLCAGTGEIAFDYLKDKPEPCKAFLLDFSAGMLREAEEKAGKLNFPQHEIQYLVGDAQKIPLPDNSVDSATIAYGIRNVSSPEACARDVLRVLKPGGVWGVLELTRPKNSLLRSGHQLYLKTLLPLIGRFVAKNKEAYGYLSRTVGNFTPPDELALMLNTVGFEGIRTRPLLGGTATLILAHKAP